MENIPKSGPVLLVANHIDYLDGWLLSLLLKQILKRRVYFISQSRNYFWAGETTIPLDKYGPEGSLNRALAFLKKGRTFVLFPEGERNSEKRMLKGKTGAARLELWSRCPIIPIGIIGPSSSSFWGSVIQALLRPKAVTIMIGKAIDLSPYYNKEITYNLLENCTKKIMQAIGNLAEKEYPY